MTIHSGRDTTLAGAQVSGNRVLADIGRNLTIASLQDSDHYDSKQNSRSGGAGYTFGTGTASAGISASRDKMSSDFTSVQEQSGMFAGQGGFDIRVGEHTQLDGGVIASTATADKNRLDTGTLGWRDIHNQADFKTEHQGAGFSTGGSIAGQFAGNMANSMLAGGGNSGHAEGTTRSAIDNGTLIIRDKENQTQDVAGLSRDTEHANGSISPIFDKEKEQRRLQEVQLIGEIGSQAADIARTQGQIAGEKAKNDPAALQAARKQLAASGRPYTEDDVAQKAWDNAMSPFGTGSALQKGIQAATAAVQGLAGGNIGEALSGAAAPYLAEVIKKSTGDNKAANAMAHAVLGAVTSWAGGNSALSGAAGAATAELLAPLIVSTLGWDKDNLTETQKQTVSALSTLAAGLAGGLTGDSTADTVAGAQGGKNAVENNSLSIVVQGGKLAAQGCMKISTCRDRLIGSGLGALLGVGASTSAMDALSKDEQMNLIYVASLNDPALLSKLNDAQKAAYESLTGHTIPDTGGSQTVNPGPTNTGGNQSETGNIPSNTGNNQASGQGPTSTGNTDGKLDTGGNTTVTPIPEGPNKDDLAYLALKGKEAQEAAGKLGFDRRIPAQKAPFNSHGQPVFYDGKNYITPDVDSHNVTNGWKMFDRRGKRIGTYDSDLNRIKD